jgi:hypothetical protein
MMNPPDEVRAKQKSYNEQLCRIFLNNSPHLHIRIKLVPDFQGENLLRNDNRLSEHIYWKDSSCDSHR